MLLVPVAPERVDAILAGDLDGRTAGRGWPHEDTAIALEFSAAAGGLTWLVAVDDVVVGELGTKGPVDAPDGVEIGYGLAAPSRGAGLGTRAVAALVGWLLERDEVQRIVAHVDPANTASVRLLRRLDFVRVGHEAGEDVYELGRPR